MKPYIVGDSVYTLQTQIQKPAKGIGSHDQNAYDKCLHRGCVKIENSFGILKNRWTILKNLNVDVKHAGLVITACCVLHNFCHMNHDICCIGPMYVKTAECKRRNNQSCSQYAHSKLYGSFPCLGLGSQPIPDWYPTGAKVILQVQPIPGWGAPPKLSPAPGSTYSSTLEASGGHLYHPLVMGNRSRAPGKSVWRLGGRRGPGWEPNCIVDVPSPNKSLIKAQKQLVESQCGASLVMTHC